MRSIAYIFSFSLLIASVYAQDESIEVPKADEGPELPQQNHFVGGMGGPQSVGGVGGLGSYRARPGQLARLSGANFTCALNSQNDTINNLRRDATSLLTELDRIQRECAESSGVAGAQGASDSRFRELITNLSRPGGTETCVVPEVEINQRYDDLQLILSRGTTEGSFIRVTNGSQLQSMFRGYSPCITNDPTNYSQSLVDTTCLDLVRRNLIAQGQRSPTTPDGQRACAQINEETAAAIQNAFAATTALVNGGRCQGAVGLGASLLNVGVGLALSNPVSLPIAGLARMATSFINGIFGRNYRSAQRAMEGDQMNALRRSAQCLFMHSHKASLCSTDRSQELAQTRQSRASAQANVDELNRRYRGTHAGKNPDTEIQSCTPGQQIATSEDLGRRVSSLSGQIEQLEGAINGDREAAGYANQVRTKFDSVCDSLQPSSERLVSIPSLSPLVTRVQSLCSQETPKIDDLRAAFVESDGTTLSYRLSRAARNAAPPEPARSPASIAANVDECLRNRGGESLLAYNTARQQLATLDRTLSGLQDVTSNPLNQNTEVTELFQSLRRPLMERNGTSLNLSTRVREVYEDVQRKCANTSIFQQAVNELHATCLLNAGASLYSRDSVYPVYEDNRNAQAWQQSCSYFLRSPELAPQLNGQPFSITPGPRPEAYQTWQCEAFTNFERFSSALPPTQDLFRTFCGGGTENRQRSPGSARRDQ